MGGFIPLTRMCHHLMSCLFNWNKKMHLVPLCAKKSYLHTQMFTCAVIHFLSSAQELFHLTWDFKRYVKSLKHFVSNIETSFDYKYMAQMLAVTFLAIASGGMYCLL